ncbi:unnamed protein product [Musa hybrid cultivar]
MQVSQEEKFIIKDVGKALCCVLHQLNLVGTGRLRERMECLSPNSLRPTRLLQTLEKSRVRCFPTYQSGAPNPTFHRVWSLRLSRRAPPSMAAVLSSQENSAPVATPKSPIGITWIV